ncbi:hypothetical protein, partial [Micromonospora andamanensis]|uniref:hypothetical protein n=1 Tax=Micromonospora andamanensis TaxID=1287068 RepID=UPI001EF3B355
MEEIVGPANHGMGCAVRSRRQSIELDQFGEGPQLPSPCPKPREQGSCLEAEEREARFNGEHIDVAQNGWLDRDVVSQVVEH